MKNLLYFLAFNSSLVLSNVHADEIKTFDEFSFALEKGHRFHYLIHYEKCALEKTSKKDNFPVLQHIYSVPTTIQHVSYFHDNLIQSFSSHFIIRGGVCPHYDYVEYTFRSEKDVTVKYSVMDRRTFAFLDDTLVYHCELGKNFFVFTE